MRRRIDSFVRSLPLDMGALTLGALLVAGCGSGPMSPNANAIYRPPQQTQGNPQQPYANQWQQGDPQGAAPPAAMSDREIGRLLARLDALEEDNKHLKQQLSDQYIKAIADRQAQHTAEPAAQPGLTTERPAPDPRHAAPPAAKHIAAVSTTPAASLSRSELVAALIDRVEASNDPGHIKALTAAALSITQPGKQIDQSLLDPLDPRTREQVARFHQMVAMAYDELAANPGKPIDRADMIANIDKVFGSQPLKIAKMELCRRVDSFGVYEPFASRRFLSGRKNPMLLYVEVENFHHEPTSTGDYEVRLEQQIEIYDRRGEVTVWRAGPDILVDECRNKRRDFFFVYRIELPANLANGSYRMKLRLADKHTGMMCEKTLHDIEIVADQALVEGVRPGR